MQLPLQITFRDIDPSPAVEAAIRERAARLERFADRITSCHATIEFHNDNHRKGRLFHCRIDIRVPGRHIVVGHDGRHNHAHEDVYVTIGDAFDAAKRQLEDYARYIRDDVRAGNGKASLP